MTELLTMALQMAGCVVFAVPVAFGAMWAMFHLTDLLERRRE